MTRLPVFLFTGVKWAVSPASSAPGREGANLSHTLWNPRMLGATLASPSLVLGEVSEASTFRCSASLR